ncbi:MAG: DUF3800 domain-containing protein [Candidatus Aminicenantales bacterium]
MPVFFLFSDAAGKYKKERSDKFISKNPFFCRASLIIEAGDWMRLREEFVRLKKKFLSLKDTEDVKWSYIWSLYKHRQKGERIRENKPYYHLRSHSLDRLVEFVCKALQLIGECESTKLIFTVTFNQKGKTESFDLMAMNMMHLRQIMDMAEYEMRKIPPSTCIFSFNPEESKVESILKASFLDIIQEKSSKKYKHIKESLCFEPFSHSFASQMADYCAGVFNGSLRLYPQSVDLFRHQLWPRILRRKSRVLGYGITEIPRSPKTRAELERIIKTIFGKKEEDYKVSAEKRLKSR